jgi:hypothetical protein
LFKNKKYPHCGTLASNKKKFHVSGIIVYENTEKKNHTAMQMMDVSTCFGLSWFYG